MIGPDADRNPTLVEAVLEKFRDVQALLGCYGIDIREECLGANNDFNSGSTVVSFYRR